MNRLVSCALLVTTVVATRAAEAGDWRMYELYQPKVERHFVVNAASSPLLYNHDSSVAWFRDRWFCLWNANTAPAESKPGQLNYMATSPDGKTWTKPVPVFASAACSENPIPCPKGTQWQPNLIVVDGELWAIWSQNSRDGYKGCYLSRLRSPDGKWENTRLLWNGSPEPLIGGVHWRVFPTQNPCRLRSGRVLAPVTISGSRAKDAPADLPNWWAQEKRDSVIYTDDLGKTWHCSPGAIIPGKSWAQWEPTVWEAADGTVLMVARNNDFRAADAGGASPATMLTHSESKDKGATWSPHRFVPLETVASRMHVIGLDGDRKVMVHNDFPAGKFVQDRRNLALFFTRGKGVDFVAGPGITGHEPVVAYPQFWRRGDELLVSYSQANLPRSIKVARISPLPKPDRHYLFPRSREFPPARPERRGDAWRFMGSQSAQSITPLALDEGVVTVSAKLRSVAMGCLVDTRTVGQRSGLVVGLNASGGAVKPFAFLNSPEHNLIPDLRLNRVGWNVLSVRIDRRQGVVQFDLNGKMAEMAFTKEDLPPFSGRAMLGKPFAESSRVPTLDGDLASLHISCAGRPEPLLSLSATGPNVNMEFPKEPVANHRIVLEERHGRAVVRVTGDGCAGLDLDDNERARGDRIEIEGKVRVMGKGDTDILTVGDANRWVCLGTRKGAYALIAGEQIVTLGIPVTEKWQPISVVSGKGRTSVRVGAMSTSLSHECEGNWAYLGRAYGLPRSFTGAWPEFQVDLASLRSRVTQAGK